MRAKVVHASLCLAVLLGAGYARAQLEAGYARTDVTPTGPVYMGGYDLRNSPSEGVAPGEKLYLRALVFRSGGARVAFVESDIILFRDHAAWRKAIARETGIPWENVLIGDVHNHSAPAPDSKVNAEWTQRFDDAIVPTVKRAVAALKPVRLAAGAGTSRVAINRRATLPADLDSYLSFDENYRSQTFGAFKTDHPVTIHHFAGEVRLGANPGGPMDDTVQLVRIDDAQGRPYVLMIHYACHGTSLGGRNSKVTGEWMGRMQSFVESQIPGLSTIYLQGAAGDINPRVVGGLDGNRDNIETTHALGEEIGREAVRVYRTLAPQPPANSRIEVVNREIQLPRTYGELVDHFMDPAVRAPTTALRIGDLMWVSFPGELFSTIGKNVKAACPATVAHLMGYTNGDIGYFPEQKAFGEGGYEPSVSHLAPNAEPVYMREIRSLMKAFQ